MLGSASSHEPIDVLLVEDNFYDVDLTTHALKDAILPDRIKAVHDGAEALDFIFCRGQYVDRGNSAPKLILLDLKLPKVDGIEVLRTLKADAKTRTVPVVMLTSSNEERDIVESYQLGVNSYIVKPVDFDKFLEMVSQVGLYWSLVNKVPQGI